MASGRIAHENTRTLIGSILCKNCKRLMLKVGPDYICNYAMQNEGHECAKSPVNADALWALIVNRMMTLILTGPTVRDVVNRVQQKVDDKDRRQGAQLAETEAALSQLRQRRSQLERATSTTDAEVEISSHQSEIEDLTNRIIALECEARAYTREREALGRMNDPEWLRKTTTDLSTYVHPAYLEYTERILEMFLESVKVGRDTATLNFKMPVPTKVAPEGALSEEIDLAPAVLQGSES